jgi:TonB family protein
MQVQVMQDQIKAKALQIATDVKQHWKVLVLASPLLLAPIFIAIVETLPVPPPKPVSITVTLPPAIPYEATKGRMAIVPSQQLVQTETKIVYVQVPANGGQAATVKPVVVQSAPGPVPLPTPVVQPAPEPITVVAPPKPTPRRVVVTPVEFGSMAHFQPDYPTDLRVAGIQGQVHVLVTVGPNGRPLAIRPLGPNNSRLVGLVQKHGMKYWLFRPATVDGVPSTGNIEVSIIFKLSDD